MTAAPHFGIRYEGGLTGRYDEYVILNFAVEEACLPALSRGNGPLQHDCFLWRNATLALPF